MAKTPEKSQVSKVFTLGVVCLSLVIFCFVLASKHQYDVSEPRTNHYTTDERIYLKTFYLQLAGYSHYEALQTAVIGEAGSIELGSDLFTWRLPGVFKFWQLFVSTGNALKSLFWGTAFITLFLVFLNLHEFLDLPWAFEGTVMLLPFYYSVLSYPSSFLFTEWWVLPFLLLGLYALITNHHAIAVIILCLSLLIRELSVIPIFVLFVYEIIWGKQHRILLSFLLALFVIILMLHQSRINKQLNSPPSIISVHQVSNRIHLPQKSSFLPLIAFGMQNYPLIKYKLHYGIYLLLLPLSVMYFASNNCNHKFSTMLLYLVSPSLVFPFIITHAGTNYWGIISTPMAIMALILLIGSRRTSKINHLITHQNDS